VGASLKKMGTNGLMEVTATADWQRGGQGGYNVAANALLTRVLQDSAGMARVLNDTEWSSSSSAYATALEKSINALLWNETVGAFRDNPQATLHPQDGNSLILWFNLTSAARKARVSAYLQSNWGELGSISPEWIYNGRNAIGTFPGSMEVLGHASSGNAEVAVNLIRRQWGYMLNTPNSTQSTFWEGFQADGQYAFSGIYMSHAHGWSTGPAAALSFYVLGLRPDTTSQLEAAYVVSPQFSGLQWCNGSLDFGDGRVHVEWRVATGVQSYTLVVDATAHSHGRGRVRLPQIAGGNLLRQQVQVYRVNGEQMTRIAELELAPEDELYELEVRGGRTRFEVSTIAPIK